MLPVPAGLAGGKGLSASTLWPSLTCGSFLSTFYKGFFVEGTTDTRGGLSASALPSGVSISTPSLLAPSETHIGDSLSCSMLPLGEWPYAQNHVPAVAHDTHFCVEALRPGRPQTPFLNSKTNFFLVSGAGYQD